MRKPRTTRITLERVWACSDDTNIIDEQECCLWAIVVKGEAQSFETGLVNEQKELYAIRKHHHELDKAIEAHKANILFRRKQRGWVT